MICSYIDCQISISYRSVPYRDSPYMVPSYPKSLRLTLTPVWLSFLDICTTWSIRVLSARYKLHSGRMTKGDNGI